MIKENEHLVIVGDWSKDRVLAKFLECPAAERAARDAKGAVLHSYAEYGKKQIPIDVVGGNTPARVESTCRVFILPKGKQPVLDEPKEKPSDKLVGAGKK